MIKQIYDSIRNSKIKNRMQSVYWIYYCENIIVKEEGVNKRYIKVLFFNRYFNEHDNLMRLYLKVNGREVIQEKFNIVSEYNSANVLGFILPVDLEETGDDVSIEGYIVDGYKVELNGIFIDNLPQLQKSPILLAYQEYVCTDGKDKIYTLPVVKDTYWMCTCGTINEKQQEVCPCCKQNFETIHFILNLDYQSEVLNHVMERIEINVEHSVEEIAERYCQAILDKYNISKEQIKEKIDTCILEEKQKQLVDDTIKNYIYSKAITYNKALSFAQNLERYIAPIQTPIITKEKIMEYLDIATMQKEYEQELIKTNKSKASIKKKALLTGLIAVIFVVSVFAYKLFMKSTTLSNSQASDIGVSLINDGKMIAKDDSGLYGLVDQNGDVIVDFEYDQMLRNVHGYYMVEKDYKYNILDEKGHEIFEVYHEYIQTTDKKENFIVCDDDTVTFMDEKENILKQYEKSDLYKDNIFLFQYYQDSICLPEYFVIEENYDKSYITDSSGSVIATYEGVDERVPNYRQSHYVAKNGDGEFDIIDMSGSTTHLSVPYSSVNRIDSVYTGLEKDVLTRKNDKTRFTANKENDKYTYILDAKGNVVDKLMLNDGWNIFVAYPDYHLYEVDTGEVKVNEYDIEYTKKLIINGDGKSIVPVSDSIHPTFDRNDNLLFQSKSLEDDGWSFYRADGKTITKERFREDVYAIKEEFAKNEKNVWSNLPSTSILLNDKVFLNRVLERYGFYDNDHVNFMYVSNVKSRDYNSKEVVNVNSFTIQDPDENEIFTIEGCIMGRLSNGLLYAEPMEMQYDEYMDIISMDFDTYINARSSLKGTKLGIVSMDGKTKIAPDYDSIWEYDDYIVGVKGKDSYLLNKKTYEVEKTYENMNLIVNEYAM